MHPMATIGPIIMGVIFLVGFIYVIYSAYRVKKRAKKIDPTVKTLEEAQYVLNKETAQNIGKNKDLIYCKSCGKDIDKDSKYCKNCGEEQ